MDPAEETEANLHSEIKANAEGRVIKTTVAVVGGGVGGLACAVALRRAGIDCVVFEKDVRFGARRNGYGMTLSADERGPLGALGVLPRCAALDCTSEAHWVFDGKSRARGYYGRALTLDSEPEPKRRKKVGGSLRVQRQQLRQVLLDAAGADVVRWGAALEDVHDDGTTVRASFSGGLTCECDVLIGADGLRSTVRGLRFGDADVSPLRCLGVGVIVGISPFRHALLERQGFYVLDGTARLFTMPFSPTLTMWQLSFALDPGDDGERLRDALRHDPAALLQEARRRTEGWGDVGDLTCALAAATSLSEVWATPLYDRDAMPSQNTRLSRDSRTEATHVLFFLRERERERAPRVFWPVAGRLGRLDARSRSRVVVLGDAAHPMTCFKGQGANQALADAPLLAKCLSARGANVVKKLRAFEREMVQRAAPRAAASREAARLLHSSAALAPPERGAFAGFDGDALQLADALADAGVSACSHADLAARVRLEMAKQAHAEIESAESSPSILQSLPDS